MVELKGRAGMFMRRMGTYLKESRGYLLIEILIALITVGAVTYLVVNTDIIPGLKAKWDMQNNAIQNNWIR
jgi:hypothetical protein